MFKLCWYNPQKTHARLELITQGAETTLKQPPVFILTPELLDSVPTSFWDQQSPQDPRKVLSLDLRASSLQGPCGDRTLGSTEPLPQRVFHQPFSLSCSLHILLHNSFVDKELMVLELVSSL